MSKPNVRPDPVARRPKTGKGIAWVAIIVWVIATAACLALSCGCATIRISHFDEVMSTAEADRGEMRTKYNKLPAAAHEQVGYVTCGAAIDNLTDAITDAKPEIGISGKHELSIPDLQSKDKKAKDACRTLLNLP